ncbi:hypothetical protein PMAYCL1PPCAC_14188, partial [Pristionchus mayeri]
TNENLQIKENIKLNYQKNQIKISWVMEITIGFLHPRWLAIEFILWLTCVITACERLSMNSKISRRQSSGKFDRRSSGDIVADISNALAFFGNGTI